MPLYDLYCDCGYEEELYLKLDQEMSRCPKCGQKMKKVMSGPTFILNGQGWARDSYGLHQTKGKQNGTK